MLLAGAFVAFVESDWLFERDDFFFQLNVFNVQLSRITTILLAEIIAPVKLTEIE